MVLICKMTSIDKLCGAHNNLYSCHYVFMYAKQPAKQDQPVTVQANTVLTLFCAK